MKRTSSLVSYVLIVCCAFLSIACCQQNVAQTESLNQSFETAVQVRAFLMQSNQEFLESDQNSAIVDSERRLDLAINGQEPYALIITCADSRVPPEHIFNAGLGDLFIVRNAGNVIGDYELGSIEYALEHLGVKYVLVLGHEECGAISSTLALQESDREHVQNHDTNLDSILDEIKGAIGNTTDPRQAEILNVENSLDIILQNPIVASYIKEKGVLVEGAIYHVDNGKVVLLETR